MAPEAKARVEHPKQEQERSSHDEGTEGEKTV
jgi:hypothetical protein